MATEVSVNTAFGVERVVRDAFARAERRPRKHLTLVHKTNVLVNAGSVWWRLFEAVAAEHPDVTTDYMHIDAAMIHMTVNPSRFDVIVTDNLFGDIITDLAAAITGGIGLAAGGNINPDRTAPSMFEPVHGSAPDIAGQQKADPTAAILSTSLLLDHLGYAEASAAVETAVLADLADRQPGTTRRTSEVGDAIAATPLTDDPSTVSLTSWTSAPRPTPTRSTTRGSPRSSPTPASASTSPTTWSPSSGRRTAAGTTRA